jgi:hypothetical protein
MQQLSTSIQIYIGLIVLLAALGALNAFLPQGDFVTNAAQGQMPASKPVMALVSAGAMLVIYGGLGYLGLRLAQRLGFADLWDPNVTNAQRFLLPALLGAGTGVIFIVADQVFSRFHSLGELPHPPFPTSIVASLSAGIGEEVIFRLFFIPFWLWLISGVLLQGRGQSTVFWIVAGLSALAFAASHVPSVMFVMGVKDASRIPIALLVEILLLNGVLSVLAAFYFRKHGILAAIGIHLWADVVWHVLWGALLG